MELFILKMIFFIYSFGVLLNCSIYCYYYYYFINFFLLLAFNFSYIKYASTLPHHLKCAPPSPGPIIFFFLNFGYTLHHRIFTAILTCSTSKPFLQVLEKKKINKKTFLRKRWLLSFLFFFFWLKCTTTPKMALYWFFFFFYSFFLNIP